jgi:hypothetical protein
VPFAESPGGNFSLYINGEIEKAQRISNGGTRLARDHRDLLLRQPKLIGESPICVRSFNRREVAALNVLNQCQLKA